MRTRAAQDIFLLEAHARKSFLSNDSNKPPYFCACTHPGKTTGSDKSHSVHSQFRLRSVLTSSRSPRFFSRKCRSVGRSDCRPALSVPPPKVPCYSSSKQEDCQQNDKETSSLFSLGGKMEKELSRRQTEYPLKGSDRTASGRPDDLFWSKN